MYATQIITGHNSLNRHLNLMFQDEPADCPKCELDKETIEHVIKNCPAYTDKRREILGEYYLSGQLHQYELDKIFKYVSAIRRLNFTA